MEKENWSFVIDLEVETKNDEVDDGCVDTFDDLFIEFDRGEIRKLFREAAEKAIEASGVKARVKSFQLWDEEMVGG